MLKELVKQLEVSDVVHILELRGGGGEQGEERRGKGGREERMREQKIREGVIGMGWSKDGELRST